MEAVNNQDTGADQFRQWCAVIELGCVLLGAQMIPIIAKQAKESFGMSLLWQRDPEPKVEILTNGEVRNTVDGERAAEFMKELDIMQNQLKAKGIDLSRDDIAMATFIRVIAEETLSPTEGA